MVPDELLSPCGRWFARKAHRLCPSELRFPYLMLDITSFPSRTHGAHGTKRTLNDVGRGYQCVSGLLARATRTFPPSYETETQKNTEKRHSPKSHNTSCRQPTSKLSPTAVTVRVPRTLQTGEGPPLISAGRSCVCLGPGCVLHRAFLYSIVENKTLFARISSGHEKRERERRELPSRALTGNQCDA
ncbi:hypothetical protein LZ31DRAFT_388817 [Colletotrichum somersetense]|nr:hypothetical protein LZ31DRAFT_388817 [Colletotrichum somersetense]